MDLQQFISIRRALRAGRRHTEIARELNLSVWTIAKIDDEQRFEIDPISEDELPIDDAPPDYVAANLRRCPGCGAMVYVWPCIACQMATMTLRVPPAPEVEDKPEEKLRLPTLKQKRWRRKRIRERVFGVIAEPRS